MGKKGNRKRNSNKVSCSIDAVTLEYVGKAYDGSLLTFYVDILTTELTDMEFSHFLQMRGSSRMFSYRGDRYIYIGRCTDTDTGLISDVLWDTRRDWVFYILPNNPMVIALLPEAWKEECYSLKQELVKEAV